jgi:hypothetical protein
VPVNAESRISEREIIDANAQASAGFEPDGPGVAVSKAAVSRGGFHGKAP